MRGETLYRLARIALRSDDRIVRAIGSDGIKDIADELVRLVIADPAIETRDTTSDDGTEPVDLSAAGWLPANWLRNRKTNVQRIVWIRGKPTSVRPPAPRSRKRSPRP